MAEIIYQLAHTVDALHHSNIEWLTEHDSAKFNEHLLLAGQSPVSDAFFKRIYQTGAARYCLLYNDDLPITRGAVEPYTDHMWEAADIRTIQQYQGRGYAKEMLRFLSNYILESGKIATCRTEDDNLAMQKVICSVGYTELVL